MRKAIKFLVCLAVLLPLLATPAAGQVMGLYYQEVEKDGRIYVFNTPERYNMWSEGGEIGTAITLIGRGPNGETVVAENETAADLFFFRHNLPGYDRETPKPPKKVEDYITYKDGKLGFKFSGGEVSLSNRVQARYTYLDDVEVAGVEDIGSFRIRRAKTTVEGKLYEYWKFKLQANWVGVNIVENVTLSANHALHQPSAAAPSWKTPSSPLRSIRWPRSGRGRASRSSAARSSPPRAASNSSTAR